MTDEIVTSDWCLESYPCQHGVHVNGVSRGTWGGRQIRQWYIDHGQKVPEHFACYGPRIEDN